MDGLLNLLRPTVAVARFIVFAALALHAHPTWASRLREDCEGSLALAFAQEVRHFYPFFPVIGGRARSAFEFQGFGFAPTGCCSASTPPITTRASGWSRGPFGRSDLSTGSAPASISCHKERAMRATINAARVRRSRSSCYGTLWGC